MSWSHTGLAALLSVLAVASGAQAFAQGAAPTPQPVTLAEAVSSVKVTAEKKGAVVILPIHGEVEIGLAAFVKRALDEHADAALILLDVNTLGGRVDAAIQIRDALLDSKAPTLGFVHRRAISAGALITLACDRVYVAAGASIGAVTPLTQGKEGPPEVTEKMISYMRAEMRATAVAKGRSGEIAEAMVDSDVIIEGVIAKGKLLTLDTDGALKHGIAAGRADSVDALLAQLMLDNRTRVVTAENWAERISRVVTSPTVSGMLLSIGMLAIVATVYTGNVGIFTGLGLLLLGLFFGGHAVVHLAGWEELLLFAIGAALLGVEAFFIPGFGVAGVLGTVAIFVSLTLSMTALPLDVSFDLGLLTEAASRVVYSLFGTIVGGFVLIKLFPHTSLGRALVLSRSSQASEGFVSAPAVDVSLVGVRAKAMTDLRPEGRVQLEDGARMDARSEQGFIEVGTFVEVIAVDGPRVIVAAVAEESTP